MKWIELNDVAQLDALDATSADRPVLIFKHSTRCSISSAALGRLERAWSVHDDAKHVVYFLDLLRFRSISDAIEQRYGVQHESPQSLVIRNGKCVDVSAHFGITYADATGAMERAANARPA
jgi:bacillithiol system protein YtxJ